MGTDGIAPPERTPAYVPGSVGERTRRDDDPTARRKGTRRKPGRDRRRPESDDPPPDADPPEDSGGHVDIRALARDAVAFRIET